MKKLLSVLLVALILVGMLPAIGASAATETATFSFAGGSGTNLDPIPFADEASGISIEFTAGNHNTKPRWDASCIRFYGTTTLTNHLTVSAPEGTTITEIAFAMNGTYKLTAVKADSGSINTGTSTWTGSASSVVFTTTAQTRFAGATVTYTAGSTEPSECEHSWGEWIEMTAPGCETEGLQARECSKCGELDEQTVAVTGHSWSGEWVEITAATCTENGEQAQECANCSELLGEAIPATGHTYVDGVCSVCGTEEPAGFVLTEVHNIKANDTVIITMTQDGVVYALANDKGSSAAPTAVKVEIVDGKVVTEATNVQWNVAYDGGDLTIYPAGTTETWLYCNNSNNGLRVGTGEDKIFVVDSTYGYLFNNGQSRYIGVYNKADWRSYTTTPTNNNIKNQTLGFYVMASKDSGETVCSHDNMIIVPEEPADCTHTGFTEAIYCPDCDTYLEGHVLIEALGHNYGEWTTTKTAGCETAGEQTKTCDRCDDTQTQAIEPTGHNYVDGVCQGCGDELVDLSGRYIIAAKTTSSNYYYMKANAEQTNYMEVEDSGLTELPAAINAGANMVFVLELQSDLTYKIYAEGIEGNNYLGWTSGNEANLVSAENAKALTVAESQNVAGAYTVFFLNGTETRNLSLNSSSKDRFAFYKGTQVNDLHLIPICEHANTTAIGEYLAPTCTAAGMTAGSKCADCGYIIDAQAEIDVVGHTEVIDQAVAATCTSTGLTEGSHCETCGEVIVEQVVTDMIDHSYASVVTPPTATQDGYTTYTCTECDHSYVGDEVPALGIGELKFASANLVLHNNLTMKFHVSADLFIADAYKNPYVIFTIGQKTQTVSEYTVEDGKYVFACTNIAPSQMGDTVTAQLYATLEDQQYVASMEYGVADYCYNMLAKTEDAKLKTLLVDLLNYGAAAQTYAWYNDKTLCNAALSDEQKAWGTAAEPALSNGLNTKYVTVDNAKAIWKAAALRLENNVTMRFRFAAESTEGLCVKIEVGGQSYYISEFEADENNAGQYYVSFSSTTARQMRETVLVTVYEGDTAVSNTLAYSVETYAYNKQNVARLGELVKAMIRYGDSAAAYLN